MGSGVFTRRQFIEAAAATTLAGKALLAAAQTATAESKAGPFKVGILGCGNRSKAHIASLNSVPEFQVAALCDVVARKMDERAKLIKTGPAPRQYVDMDKMLAQEDLDAIAIILPNDLHKSASVAAMQAGKHVLCEKPMALTVADCNEMIAVSERTRKALQIGTQRRHSPGIRKAVEAIRAAKAGPILGSDVNSYRGDWRQPGPEEYPPGVPYWRLSQERCGGVVYEMGAHIIDLNNWIFDSEPVTVVSLQGVNDRALRPRDSTDHAGVLVRYANDALMNYGGNLYTTGPAASAQIFAAGATIALSDEKLVITYTHVGGVPSREKLPPPVELDLRGGDETAEQWRHFARVLAGKAAPFPDGQTGRQTIQICQGAVVSAKEHRVVNVKELG